MHTITNVLCEREREREGGEGREGGIKRLKILNMYIASLHVQSVIIHVHVAVHYYYQVPYAMIHVVPYAK